MACARPPGSGTLCHPRRTSSGQVARASSKQEPGSTRRVTARDFQKINKIFGSNQYPAFSPTDQLGHGPPPPPTPPPPPSLPPQQPQQQTSEHQAHYQNSNGGATSTQATTTTPVRPSAPTVGGASKQKVVTAHREGGKEKGAERTRLAAAAASAAVAIEATSTWSELRPILSRSAHLGPDTLVLLAKQMDVLVSNTQLSDETELSDVQALAAEVSAAARLYIGSFSVKQLAGLLRSLLSVSWMPDDGWLLAADTATLGAMSDMMKGGDVQGGVDCDGMQDILALAAAFLAGNYTPQAAWLRLFEGLVQQLLAGLALEALQAAEEDARAATTPPRSALRPASVRQAGLIQLPQQVEADQVAMPDGSTVHFPSETTETQPQRAHQKLFGGPLRPLSLSPAAWASLVQAIHGWGIPLDHQGIQSYIEASFGAFRASAKLLKAAAEQQHQTSPEAAHSLYTTTLNPEVLADMAALPLQREARPDEAWAEVLYEATAAALEHTPVPDEDMEEELTAQVLFEVRPQSVAMLLEVLGEVGVAPDPQWVAAALGGAAACTQAVDGDDIAFMVMKVVTLKLGLHEPACTAALKLAERAHLMWAEGIEVEAERERRAREQLRTKGGRGQGTGEGVGGDDVRDASMGFSAEGILALFLGLLEMGVGGQLGDQWMEAFGQQVTRHSHAMEAEQAAMCIARASHHGMALPPAVLLPLMGRVLEVCAPPPPPANARAGTLAPSPPPTPTSPLPQDRLSDLLLALAQQQQVQLPEAWMEPLQRLVSAHLVHMGPHDVVHALKVMGSVAGRVRSDFVTSLFHHYARTPDMHTPDGCVAMAQALARVGAPPECLKAVEEASLTILPTASAATTTTAASSHNVMHGDKVGDSEEPSPLTPPSAWMYQLLAWARAAHLPSVAWWRGLVEGTGRVLGGLPASHLANLMAGYGALRALHGPSVPSFMATWADAVLGEVQARLQARATPGSTMGAADRVGDKDEGGKEEEGKKLGNKEEEEEVGYLLKGLAAFMQPHASPMCAAMERACMALPLHPALLGACLVVFVGSDYTPSDAWMHGAAAAFSERMDEASSYDLCACMVAAARMKGMRAHMPPALLARVLGAGVKEADSGRMAPSQAVALLEGAGEAGCGAHGPASTAALTLLMDSAAAMCDIMDVREVCDLLKAVRKLPLQPTPQWTATVLRGLEERDVAEAGPDAVQKLLAALDAWEPPMSASLLATLSQAVTRMGRASLEAASRDGGAAAAALGEAAVLLLQRVVNSDRGKLKAKGSMGEVEASECMSVMGELLKQDVLEPQVHANLLYSAATMATAACRRAAAAAAAASKANAAGSGPVPVTVAAERVAAAKSAAEAAAAGVPLPAWVHGLLAVAVPMTHDTMTRYSTSDLIIILSSLAALKAQLPPTWLEAVWEHSMPQLRALPTSELAALVNAASTVAAATSTRPSLSWETRLMEVVGARAPSFTVQESNTLLAALAPTGLQPPKEVVQKLLDSALGAQQVAAARVDAARSAVQTAGDAPGDLAGAVGGGSGAQPASIPAASPPTTGGRGSDIPVAVSSTRGVRGARRTAKSAASQGAAPAPDTSPSAALAAATAAADKQAVQLAQLIAFVGSELGYEPSRPFLEACQPLLAPALSSRVLTDRQRSMVSGLLHDLAHP